MSRVGSRPIQLPPGVTLAMEGADIVVTGPKGTLRWIVPAGMTVLPQDGVVRISRKSDEDQAKAYHGLTRALIANMVQGVSEGYAKQLKIVGVGYRAELIGNGLRLALGFSHPVDFPAPAGISFTVDKNVISISGIDKQLVGETAARIRAFKKPEPYKGKGIMYTDELIRRKPGKAAKAAGPGARG